MKKIRYDLNSVVPGGFDHSDLSGYYPTTQLPVGSKHNYRVCDVQRKNTNYNLSLCFMDVVGLTPICYLRFKFAHSLGITTTDCFVNSNIIIRKKLCFHSFSDAAL